jgi:hypothetical protein
MSETTVRHHFEQDVDTLFALVTDPGFLRRRAEAAGEQEVVVEIDRDGPQLRIRITREVEQSLPSFMKKLFSPRNRLIDSQRWSTDGPVKTSDWTVQMGGSARVQLSGRLSLAPGPDGGGCDYSESFSATADIPLLGGRIAKYAGAECAKSIREQIAFTRKELGE